VTPAAAASAWIARIPASERVAAHELTDARLVAWVLGGALLIAVCWGLTGSGVLGRLRARLEADKPRPWVASTILAAVVTLAVAAVKAPYDVLATGWLDAMRAGTNPRLDIHLHDTISAVARLTFAAMLVVPLLHAVMRKAPRAWPAMFAAAVTALSLAIWAPYALSLGPALQPAPPGPVRSGLESLVAETKLPAREIYVSTDPSLDADVTGAFGRAKVVVGPELMQAPPAETRAMVAHIMGHYAHGDILAICLIYGLCSAFAVLCIWRLGAPAAQLMGARKVLDAADPEALPALLLIAALWVAAAGIAVNVYLQWANVRADAYSLQHAREPDGLAAVLEREWDHQSIDPSPIETVLFYTHPPLESRILHAMTWKAESGG
jgi:STE24 endopeptidase